MVNEARGRVFRRKDGKYLIYVPLDLAEDSMFPFRNYEKTPRGADAVKVKVFFKIGGPKKLEVTEWTEEDRMRLGKGKDKEDEE